MFWQSFLERLRPLPATQRERVVRAVAEATLAVVDDRLSGELQAMNRSELRGYVRARARRLATRELRSYLVQHPLLGSVDAEVILGNVLDLVTQQVVRRTMGHLAPITARNAA